MKRASSIPSPIDIVECRRAWRLCDLGCAGDPEVQAVMLYAVAKAINRPIEAMPRPELDLLWASFKSAIRCTAVKWPDLPLPLLSPGERFALAVGVLFNADQLPTGQTFLELTDSATGCGTGAAGRFALGSVLGLPTVQAVLPADVFRLHGAKPSRDYSPDELDAAVREAMDALDGITLRSNVMGTSGEAECAT